MPLIPVAKGSTKKQRQAITSQNISELEDSGRPHDQAVAIALSSARRPIIRKRRSTKRTPIIRRK